MSHTPGPWRNEMGDIYADVDGSEYLIAEADGDGDLTQIECEANANLIAAAPDLLVLLKSSTELIEQDLNSIIETSTILGADGKPDLSTLDELARADVELFKTLIEANKSAIAKAEGGAA